MTTKDLTYEIIRSVYTDNYREIHFDDYYRDGILLPKPNGFICSHIANEQTFKNWKSRWLSVYGGDDEIILEVEGICIDNEDYRVCRDRAYEGIFNSING
jgi:hypothetical protein